MSNTVWGIVWVKDGREENGEPVWYESEEDAEYEFDSRDGDYWPSRLVTGTVRNIEIVRDGYHERWDD